MRALSCSLAFRFFPPKVPLIVLRPFTSMLLYNSVYFTSLLMRNYLFSGFQYERRSSGPTHNDLFFLCFSQLLKSSEGPVLRRRRHLDSSKPYIAAKLDSLPTTFTLGDEKRYHGFYNKPLTSAQEYLCFVLAVLRYEGADTTANYVRHTDTKTHTNWMYLNSMWHVYHQGCGRVFPK